MCSDTRDTDEPHSSSQLLRPGEVLVIEITPGDPRPIFRQIVDGLRRSIARGALPPGSRLPSVRGLALQLRISLNTVAKAYTQLIEEGLIESRKGVGVFVCEPKQRLSEAERLRRLDEAIESLVNATLSLGFDTETIVERLRTAHAPLAQPTPDDTKQS
ncbi:MAG: GntR family transcriptional regulator [Thermoanaerobaculia bacterium]|nr:GntR family transcriptional regulator [Thermoanaerobaculia bacterium]